MAEVGIHLEYIVVLLLDGPLETKYIGGAQAQLSLALDEVDAPLQPLGHQVFHDLCRAVGRAVVDDQHVELVGQGSDCQQDVLDVLSLVVRGDDYDRV